MSENMVVAFGTTILYIYRGWIMGSFGPVKRVGKAGETLQSEFDYFEV